MAEEKGFEPLRRSHDLPVFKTGPFNQTWVFLQLSFFRRQNDYNTTNEIVSTIISYNISFYKKTHQQVMSN